MSVQSIIEAALQKARTTAGGSDKTASAGGPDLIKLAHQLADANEFIALSVADDGTTEGQVRRSVVENFFKGAGGEKVPGPEQSESLTGTQAVPPQSGAKKILPLGKASGNSPAESGAPTGTQATLDQTGTKAAGMTLLDMLTKNADTTSIPGPKQSVAGENAAAPPAKNENTNIDALRSAAGMVALTKREAKLPTRERLKKLFAHAGDTSASSAAAHAAFPMAASKGGLKVAEAEKREEKDPDGEGSHGRRVGIGAGIGAGVGALAGLRGGVGGGQGIERAERESMASKKADAGETPQRPSILLSAGKGALVGAAALGVLGAGVGGTAGRSLQAKVRSLPMGVKRQIMSELLAYHGPEGVQMAKKLVRNAGLLGAGAGALGAGAAGVSVGAPLGGIYGAGRKRQFVIDHADKKASLYDYAKLAEIAATGELGDEARAIILFAESLPV